jgi:dynein heavy chain
VESFLLVAETLKLGLTTETKAWRLHYGKVANNKYKSDMENIFTFIEDLNKRLTRPIKDLDDIRFAMAALKEIRENEIRVDMSIGPIEVGAWLSYICLDLDGILQESYAMLNKHDLPVAKEETERVDTLRYSWQKLQAQASTVSSHLIEIQPGFKSKLIENVKLFHTETADFYGDYHGVRL